MATLRPQTTPARLAVQIAPVNRCAPIFRELPIYAETCIPHRPKRHGRATIQVVQCRTGPRPSAFDLRFYTDWFYFSARNLKDRSSTTSRICMNISK